MTTPGFKRKLIAIFMADVVGYSRLMGENEAATLRTLTIYQGIMDGLIKQHRGRVVDAPGDAVLAEFISVVDAVQCAVAVQKELEARNAELPEDSRMQFRIGINLGDVIEEGEKIYGDGVNIAARLEALAPPGGICISKTAFDHIETKLPLGYEFLGDKTVKNIARPVGAYRVLLEPRITVAGKTEPEKPPKSWSLKPVVAASLVTLMAAISLLIWKSGFFSSPPVKQTVSSSPQSPAPQPTKVTPAPEVSPAKEAQLPKKAPQKAIAPLPKEASPTPIAPPPAKETQLPKKAPQKAIAPLPKEASPAPQAASPTKEAQLPQKDHQPTIALLPKEASPTPIAPSTATVPPIRDKTTSFFHRLDTDGDGKVTLSEFLAWREKQFDILDENKDGSLSRSEVEAGKTNFARLLRQNFDRIDLNRDQMLSREEFREVGRRRFLRMDKNRHGYLTQEELAEAQAKQE